MNHQERIANDGFAAVDVCCHDRATLHVGPVSMRLDRESLDRLARLLTKASRRLVLRDEHGAAWRERFPAPDLEL